MLVATRIDRVFSRMSGTVRRRSQAVVVTAGVLYRDGVVEC
jgi:hypothetical protein